MAEVETEYNVNLIVEDGSCVSSANSYVTLAFADAYAVNRNYTTWVQQSDYVKSAAIIKAMDYVDNIFDWKGTRMYKDQSLCFPRKNIIDDDGFDRTGEIPDALKRAICEAAFYVYKQYTLYITQDVNGTLKKDKKKADVVETEKEYFSKKEVEIDYTSAYQSLDTILRGLFNQKGSGKDVNVRVHWD